MQLQLKGLWSALQFSRGKKTSHSKATYYNAQIEFNQRTTMMICSSGEVSIIQLQSIHEFSSTMIGSLRQVSKSYINLTGL